MKKSILIIVLAALCVASYPQKPFSGFFKPVPRDLLEDNLQSVMSETGTSHAWLFRPAATITALQLTYNKEFKTFQASSLTSAGIGISYAHFIDNEGVPYSDYGFNLLVLTDTELNGVTFSDMYIAGTVSAFQFISVGAGYNLGLKQFFFLSGVTINFNRPL